jgi:hypothetical protein
MVRLGRRNHSRDYGRYVGDVQEVVQRYPLEAHHGTLKKGEALIWAANLLHGGTPRRDPRGTRHSQVTNYFFESCRYFRPVQSSTRAIDWFTPAVIPRQLERRAAA